ALSGVVPAGPAGTPQSKLGRFRQQPAREVLRADCCRPQTPPAGSRRLEPAGGGDRVCAQHATRASMSLLSSLRSAASALFHRARVENETDEEFRAHVQNRADDLERSGLMRTEAERRARIEFGAHQKFKE